MDISWLFYGATTKGGPGSGFSGHVGRPGKRGGSARGSGISLSEGSDLQDKMRTTPLKRSPGARYSPGIGLSMVVEVKGDGRAIVKAGRSSRVMWANVENEVGAYEISKILGFDGLVPETIADTVGKTDNLVMWNNRGDKERLSSGENVSIQHWEDDCTLGYNYDGKIDEDSLIQMGILDVVMQNIDRHQFNYLVNNQTRKAVAIDNGGAFVNSTGYSGPWYKATYEITGHYSKISSEYVHRLRKFFEPSDSSYDPAIKNYFEDNFDDGEHKYLQAKVRVKELIDDAGEG